jgi:hypothetical protein
MGGCYVDYSERSSFSSRRPSIPRLKPRAKPNPAWRQKMSAFSRSHDISDLLDSSKAYFRSRQKGFIAQLSKVCGVKSVENIPKEFPEIEYEVKFDIRPNGRGQEPSVVAYLDAFDFPVGGNTRFIKDPINNFAVGINHFIGDSLDERVVVIEKAGKTYLKEKGEVVPVRLGVPYEQIVVKRTEVRYESPMQEVLKKVNDLTSQKDVSYRGKIRKEKGDVFVLDVQDGRIYSFTVTRAHLTKVGETKESGVQRQLEIEYAGYIPGFRGFKKDSEEQLVRGIVDLAKYTFGMYDGAPISDGWRMNLAITSQRKYDFVLGKASRDGLEEGRAIEFSRPDRLLLSYAN